MTPDLGLNFKSAFLFNRLICDNPKFRIPRCEVSLSAPIVGMDKVICIGMNYRDHCEEQNAPVPTEPVVSPTQPD